MPWRGRGVGRVPRVVSHAETRGNLGDRCTERYRLGGRSNNTISQSGPMVVECKILRTRAAKARDPGVRSSNLGPLMGKKALSRNVLKGAAKGV